MCQDLGRPHKTTPIPARLEKRLLITSPNLDRRERVMTWNKLTMFSLLALALLFSQNARAENLVGFRVETTDLIGTPISSVTVGNDFLVKVYVEDLRATPSGVFSAYLDLIYPETLLSVAGSLLYGEDYPNAQSGDTSEPGLIDEAGGFAGFSELGGGEFLLLTIRFKANEAGVANFVADPADESPSHDVLLYGMGTPILAEEILYGSTSINIDALKMPCDSYYIIPNPNGGGSVICL